MDSPRKVLKQIEALLERNPKYKLEAYRFMLSALHFTMLKVSPPRHITGQEFCEGIKEYAIDQFGPMAKSVLNFWGIESTFDFGEIVFALIEIGLMRKTEEDSLEDFRDVYSFDHAFRTKGIFDSSL